MSYLARFVLVFLGLWYLYVQTPLALAETHQNSLSLAQSEFIQGSRYYYGLETEKDMDKALSWYMKSAEKGHAKSELAVSQVLSFGDFKNRRFEEALPWLIKASMPHTTPQISGSKKAEATAKKNLRWMCKKGLVDFPDEHPYAYDPKCWLKRGNRLFYGSSQLDYHLFKDKSKYYGIKKDYVSARHYLEKAFEAGEEKASINLAKIYKNGLGVKRDAEKFHFYVAIASDEGHGKSSYYLAEQALESKDHSEYIEKLHASAQEGYWKATSKLSLAYFNGEYVDKNSEMAFMYFFLSGKSSYVRNRDARHGDTRLPFIKNTFLPIFQTEISLELLEKAHQDALNFAKDNNFRSSQMKKIDRSYNIAVSDFHYVQETGGEWHKSATLSRLSYYFLFFVLMMVISSVARRIVHRS